MPPGSIRACDLFTTVHLHRIGRTVFRVTNRSMLRHYDLANRGSVMAVETEDLGRAKGEGFELLGRAPGAVIRGCSLAYESLVGNT